MDIIGGSYMLESLLEFKGLTLTIKLCGKLGWDSDDFTDTFPLRERIGHQENNKL